MTKSPEPVDVQVGKLIRAQRQAIGWSQTQLADAIGLTFQQVQKYEKGFNRVGSSRLVQIASTRRMLSVKMASLDRAKLHARFVEHKISSGTKVATEFPFVELAAVCFKAAEWMPQGTAAQAVRKNAAIFYTRGIAKKEAAPSEKSAKKMIFDYMITNWINEQNQK
jgi:transcriptional regulator with XRE-family HTH domain